MPHPINSVFIFRFLMEAKKLKFFSSLYKELYLEAGSSGSRFKDGHKGKCWWPSHSSWHDAMKRITNNAREDTNVVCSRKTQEFVAPPGTKNGSKLALSEQWTFESCLYDVLKNVYKDYYDSKDADFLFAVLKCGDEKHYQLTRQAITEISEHTSFESLARFLILRARDAKGNPLDCEEMEVRKPPAWRIVKAEELNMDTMEISKRIMKNDMDLYKRLPPECQGSQEQWSHMIHEFSRFCRFLVDPSGKIQGNFSFIGLNEEQEEAISQGRLADASVDIFACDRLTGKGEHHVGYLLNISVNNGVEREWSNKLWDTFVDMLKDLAKEDILFSKIYYKAFLPEHGLKVLARGFDYLCPDDRYGSIYVHNMDPDTTMRVLDPKDELDDLYRERKLTGRKTEKLLPIKKEANEAFCMMFREIDEIFYDQRFSRLKCYFTDETDKMPEDPQKKQLGIALAELLRDLLQYARAFLEYLDTEQRNSYYQQASRILNSKLVQESQVGYTFTTEREDQQEVTYTAVSPRAMLHFATVWTDIDKLFLRDDLLQLRKYFYRLRHQLPPEEQMEQAVALCIRILSGMRTAENYLKNIPDPLRNSYFDYKDTMKDTKIVQETIRRHPFLAEELHW